MIYYDSLVHQTTESPEADGVVVPVFVDGSHSSGKTTLTRDYTKQYDLIADEDCDFGTSHDPITPYPYVCVIETIGDRNIPVVVASERATMFAMSHPSRNMLTSDYNREDQAAITARVVRTIDMAAHLAGAMACKLQPDQPRPISAVISDRGPLAGFAYAETRLPMEDHDVVRLQELVAAEEGFLMANFDMTIHLRRQAEMMTWLAERVFITDVADIELKDNGLRELNDTFRRTIQTAVTGLYTPLVEPTELQLLRGNRIERRDKFTTSFRSLLRQITTAADRQ